MDPIMPLVMVIADSISTTLGIIGGILWGQSDARESDATIFETITTKFCEFMFGGLAAITKIQLSKDEIEDYRKKWFDPAIDQIKMSMNKRRRIGSLLIIIGVALFIIFHLVAALN
jgi:peptidoglycan/LPS O-acetylase OafA/YrhL